MATSKAVKVGGQVLQVNGITCMDCALKFEQHVQALPGVESAKLNALTGRLTVDGFVDLDAIQKVGAEENYKIDFLDNLTESKEGSPTKEIDWRMIRMILSGFFLATGFLAEWFHSSDLLTMTAFLLAVFFGGWGNFIKASRALPRLRFNMSVLMTIAVFGAIAIGQWEEAATVAFLFSLSEMLEGWTMDRARRSIRELMDLSPKVALVRRGCSQKVEMEIPVEEIRVGDIMLIGPGQKIAMDGLILQGESAIEEASITGESVPAEKGPGDEVFAGTINSHGALEVKVTKAVQDSTISKIIHLVEEAQAKKAPSQAFVERFAAIYTPIVMALAVLIALIPPLFMAQEWGPWIYRALALLVVACPCALIVSTPVAVVSAISKAARQGVLIKGGVYLEEAGALKAIAFDKTGTLTKGEPVVTDVIPLGGLFGNVAKQDEKEIFQLAGSLEARSEHPLAKAIVKAAKRKGLILERAENFQAFPGKGAQGIIKGEKIYIGSKRLFEELTFFKEIAATVNIATKENIVSTVDIANSANTVDIANSKEMALKASIDKYKQIDKQINKLQAEGKTAILLGNEKELLAIIALADEVRETSKSTIMELKKVGITKTVMLTGDNQATAKAIAQQTAVDEFYAELLPHQKVEVLEKVIEKQGKVAMVGDGINDAPALARANVGIAMGGAGTDTALETADIALMSDDLTKLPYAIQLSRKTLSIIRQNIAFSIGIKVIALLAVFPGWLTLWLAILADMGASIIVTLNSLRLLGFSPKE
ncbi:cadmium-translocating P-type ATPase [Heliorestis acidaminivorans]|uniref:Cd(2+)-exporting ATPase n=1 Tax=Heliorestis acidaminivorans TaxID=553427 RepID=A0A6I0EY94_9FIRM|nr:heavy metal translocating P-type ATPase [Heliorestis acidaminivorans]KAB2953391.1 cadmium-translocating P-type ATPase [Heliorestis acidaminivorans]